eukprot:m.489652 g.489652  ORF g.489652 m.489652 type:complete len:56 (-) comp57240_c0_seq1:179-346(-)
MSLQENGIETIKVLRGGLSSFLSTTDLSQGTQHLLVCLLTRFHAHSTQRLHKSTQ